jgi:hypothetical protein
MSGRHGGETAGIKQVGSVSRCERRANDFHNGEYRHNETGRMRRLILEIS